MIRRNIRRHPKENAQGIVEFALVLPILLLVIVGIMEMGRLLFFYSSVVSASREGARYAAAVGDVGGVPRYADCGGIRAAALKAGSFAGLVDDDIDIVYDDGNTPYPSACEDLDPYGISLADRVVVTASGNFTPAVPLISVFFPDEGVDVNSVTARTIIKDVRIPGTPRPVITIEPLPTPVCPPTTVDASAENQTVKISIPNPDINYVYHLKEIEVDFPITQTLETITFTSPYTLPLSLAPSETGGNYHIVPDEGKTFIWYGRFANPGIMEITFDSTLYDFYIIKVLFSECALVTGNYVVPYP